jgi:hypothetical protein
VRQGCRALVTPLRGYTTSVSFADSFSSRRSLYRRDYMLNYILVAAQITVLLVIGVLLWQIWRKFKSIPEDEVIGEDHTKYMTRRLTWIAICCGLEAALQITSAIQRILEII